MRVSVIDLGFNSLKMVCYEVRDDGSAQIFDQASVMARLGEGLSQTGFLGAEQMRRTIDALKLFRDIAETGSMKTILPIGTSPLREAGNCEQFLVDMLRETGFKFRVLSGREEALYSFLGAALSVSYPSVLFFDLGGGSLEIVRWENSRIRKVLSLPIGVLRLTQLYADPRGRFSKKSYNRMKKRVLDLLPSRRELGFDERTVLVGVGGTVRAMARFDEELEGYPMDKIHNYSLARDSVERITARLRKYNHEELARIDSIGEDRAETIFAGATVVRLLMEKLSARRLVVSTHGLRDGILASYVASPPSYHRGDSNGQEIAGLLDAARARPAFPRAQPLIDMLRRSRLLSVRECTILESALGEVLRRGNDMGPETLFHTLLIEDSVLSHHDQLLMALSIVRSRRARLANWLQSAYEAMLETNSKGSVRRMAASLRMAELMERTERQITVKRRSKKIEMKISGTDDGYPVYLLADVVSSFENSLKVTMNYSFERIEAKLPHEGELRVGGVASR